MGSPINCVMRICLSHAVISSSHFIMVSPSISHLPRVWPIVMRRDCPLAASIGCTMCASYWDGRNKESTLSTALYSSTMLQRSQYSRSSLPYAQYKNWLCKSLCGSTLIRVRPVIAKRAFTCTSVGKQTGRFIKAL